jgi:hypothetical protein
VFYLAQPGGLIRCGWAFMVSFRILENGKHPEPVEGCGFVKLSSFDKLRMTFSVSVWVILFNPLDNARKAWYFTSETKYS